MIRLTPRPGTPVDPTTLSSVDDIVQARIDKRISRRQLIERAGQLGIGAAVTGIMLRAAGEVDAAPGGAARRTGAATPGRRDHPGRRTHRARKARESKAAPSCWAATANPTPCIPI